MTPTTNAYEMLARSMKVNKLVNFIEPLLRDSSIPVSAVQDMPAEWWRDVAQHARVKFPGEQTRRDVVVELYGRDVLRRKNAKGAEGGAGNTAA